MDVVILVLRYLDECCHVLAYVRVITALTQVYLQKNVTSIAECKR